MLGLAGPSYDVPEDCKSGLSIPGQVHPTAGRHSDVAEDNTWHIEHYVHSAQTAERAQPDLIYRDNARFHQTAGLSLGC
jgi:hypothetical protein